MGCDIHWFVERQRDDGAWEVVSEADGPHRYYNLFFALAGVRYGTAVPIAEPRGLPDDVSDEVKRDSDDWGCDGHSHSWHTLETLLAYDWESSGLGNFRGILNQMAALGLPDRVRAVFWFDN